MPLTRGFTDEIKGLNAEPITGSAESELLDDTLSRIAKHIDSPVRLYASETPDENLNIGSNVVESGDGSGEVAPPIEYNTGAFVGGVVSFQAKTATATIKVDGGAFSFPAGTVGDYRRLAVALQSDGTVDCTWSDAFGSVPALPNPGSMFAVLSGIAYGYVDLECTDVVGKYKTIGSADPVIENKVGSNIRIFRFSSSSAVAGLRTDFNKFVGSGVGPGWYPTIADATPTDGDRILVVEGYELDATETWAFSNVTIVFMPNQKLTSSAATTSAIVISGSGNRIYDLWSLINIASSLTNGLVVSGTDNQVYGVTVEAGNAGLTLTNAVSLTGQRNTVIGDRLVTAGAITYKIGTTATDSAALISGSFQNPEGEPEFTKYVGTKPTNSDGKNWFTTLAIASPAAGDRILVVTGYSIAATETWSFSDVTIVFMPNQQLTFTAATTSVLIISGNRNRIYDLWVKVNIAASLTNGISLAGLDNHLYGVMVEGTNAGLTLTNAFDLSGQRNLVVGDRLATAGAITNKIGTTATDSAALVSGSFQNPEGEPEFTKYVGTKPTNSDGKNWYTTIALATPTAGDRILVVTGYSLAATETWSFSDAIIIFMPNQKLTFTGATTNALVISGNNNAFYDMYLLLNLSASLTNGVLLSGNDNSLVNVTVESGNSGLTVTNAFNATGLRNNTVGDRKISTGIIQKEVADATQVFLPGTAAGTAVITAASTTGVVAGMTVSGKWIPAGSVVISFVVNTSITINQNASGSGATVLYFSSDNLTRVSCHINTNMYDVGGFARISSPTQSVKGAGNESLDCSAQHIFYKTGGAATIELLNLNEGQTVNVVMASTGSDYSITWSPVPKWATATQPVETIAASKYDFYTFIKIGGMVFGSAVLNMS